MVTAYPVARCAVRPTPQEYANSTSPDSLLFGIKGTQPL